MSEETIEKEKEWKRLKLEKRENTESGELE